MKRFLISVILACFLLGCSNNSGNSNNSGATERRTALQEIVNSGGSIFLTNGISLRTPDADIADIESPFEVSGIHIGNSENPADNDDLKWLQYFPETKFVGLYGNEINGDGLGNFHNLSSLESLTLSDTKNITPAVLFNNATLRNLQSITFMGSTVNASTLDGIDQLTGMQCVQIIQASNFTDEGLQHLSSMTNLRRLDLIRTPINGSGLVHLKNLQILEELGLVSTKIDGASIEIIGQLKQLKKLDIRDTEIDADELKRLSKLLPDCDIRHFTREQ